MNPTASPFGFAQIGLHTKAPVVGSITIGTKWRRFHAKNYQMNNLPEKTP